MELSVGEKKKNTSEEFYLRFRVVMGLISPSTFFCNYCKT